MADARPVEVKWGAARATAVGSVNSLRDETSLALRVIAHLANTGPPLETGLGRAESTQAGIARSLQVTQGGVSKVLRKLRDGDIVRNERRHVPGHSLRVTVYSLTRRGELMVESVRARPRPRVGPP